MRRSLLNVSAIRIRTRVNGPGLRSAVWVQGCSLQCRGCFNPETHAHSPRTLWVPETLAERMMDPDAEGVTILGGEPFEQAAACARLAKRARSLGGSVVVYSGYSWTYLSRSQLPEIEELLAATDLLIAGPFVASQPTDGRGWHGSTNQELVFLSSRYDESIRSEWNDLPIVELRTDGRTLDWTGIPAEVDTCVLESD